MNYFFNLLVALLLTSCSSQKIKTVNFEFIDKRAVLLDKIEEEDKYYLFSTNHNIELKFPVTLREDSLATQECDVLISLCFPIKNVLRNTKETRLDDCTKESTKEPVEVILDTTVEKSVNSIFIYKVFPKGKYRTICF